MPKPIVHLVYKTHLDIGFTALAHQVTAQYMELFIPRAIRLATATRDAGEHRFRWTTGAWLIHEYLEKTSNPQRKAMEDAIIAGDIVWHALPFTTHTELMDASLFRFGLHYSQALDQRFGRVTIAAKMTDVPGHTRAIVPTLAEAGVKLLHIGVNEASTVPDVPPVFIWRDPISQHELIVIYDQNYGGLTSLPFLSHHLALVLTGDNLGPPSDAQIAQTCKALKAAQPDAQIVASTMDDYARQLDAVRGNLPVVTDEIGDTWIHGVGSDPTKVRQYRALCQLRSNWLAHPQDAQTQSTIAAFSRPLLMIAEHTWGLDEKVHLPNTIDYMPEDVAILRRTAAGKHFESSWKEQRDYLSDCLSALQGTPLAQEAIHALASVIPTQPHVADWQITDDLTLATDSLMAKINVHSGAITQLKHTPTARNYADAEHLLGVITYQVFGQDDYDRYWSQYIRNKDVPEIVEWATQDNTKPGLPILKGQSWHPIVTQRYQRGDCRLLALTFPSEAVAYGAPQQLYLEMEAHHNTIDLRLSWFTKSATRLAEALWMSFTPAIQSSDGWSFTKVGQFVDPRKVVSRGARTLHAIDGDMTYQHDGAILRIITHDAPLVAPSAPSLLNFHNHLPDMRGGVHVNLYNNVWGTNFPMWFDEDALFRFSIQVESGPAPIKWTNNPGDAQ